MAIEINKVLTSDLTFSLAPEEIQYIQIRGNLATCLLSAQITTGGAYKIQATIASTETFHLPDTTYSSLVWEDIKISGVEYSELTIDINSVLFNSPNVLRIENTSTGTEALSISLRGNR